jgi:hypothetical protein
MAFNKAWMTLAALAMTGCYAPSLEPLYTDKEMVTDPGLAGNWQEKDDTDSFTILDLGAGKYRFTSIEKDKAPDLFVLRLVQLGDYRFYDLFPEGEPSGSDFRQEHFVAVHSFGRVLREGDTVRMASLNEDWLKEALAANPALLAHHRDGDKLLILAPTKDLQKFALAHAAHPKAFENWGTWTRKK